MCQPLWQSLQLIPCLFVLFARYLAMPVGNTRERHLAALNDSPGTFDRYGGDVCGAMSVSTRAFLGVRRAAAKSMEWIDETQGQWTPREIVMDSLSEHLLRRHEPLNLNIKINQ